MNDDVDLLMIGGVNPEVNIEAREEARQRLHQALLQQQPLSTNKVLEAASKIEESVFVATLTKEDYDRMISTRITFLTNNNNNNSNNSNCFNSSNNS